MSSGAAAESLKQMSEAEITAALNSGVFNAEQQVAIALLQEKELEYIATEMAAGGYSAAEIAAALATNGVEAAEIAAALAAAGFSQKQTEAALAAKGYTADQIEAATATLTFSASEKAATVSTDKLSSALKGLWATVMANPVIAVAAAVIAAIYGVCRVIEAHNQKVKEQIAAAKESASAYKQQTNEIENYADRISELRKQIDSGTLSEEESYKAKTELLQIQRDLNDINDGYADKLDLVNGKLEDQLELLNSISIAEANKWITENQSGIDEAIKQMEAVNKYWLGSGIEIKPIDQEEDLLKQIESITEQYEHIQAEWVEDANGVKTLGIVFTGNVTEADDEINRFAADVRALQEESGDEYDYSGIFDNILSDAQESSVAVQGVLDESKDVYDQWKEYSLLTSRKNVQGDLTGDLKYAGTLYDLYQDYAKAVNEYNDALLGGDTSKIEEAQTKFEGVKDIVDNLVGNDALGIYEDMFDGITASVDTSSEALYNFKKALSSESNNDIKTVSGWSPEKLAYEIENLANVSNKAGGALGGAADLAKDFGSATTYIDGEAYTLNGTLIALVDKARELGIVGGEAGEYTKEQIDTVISALSQLGYITSGVAEEVAETGISIKDSFEEAQESVEALTTAVSESATATGLSAESIEAVEKAFSGLDGYDASKLFENTANGVHLNREELERLNKEYETGKKLDYIHTLKELQKQYDKLAKQIDACGDSAEDAAKKEALIQEQQGIYDQIQQVSQLQSQYEGLTSAYNKFLQAQSAGDERDPYQNIADSYENVEDLIQRGWSQDKEVTEYLDLLLNERTGNNIADFEALTKTIEGTKFNLMDFFIFDDDNNLVTDGLFNFLDAVKAKLGDDFVQIAEDGTYSFDFTGDKIRQVAEALNMSEEAIQLLIRAMGEADGFEVVLGPAYEAVENLNQALEDAQDRLDALDGVSYDIDFNAESVEDINAEIEKTRAYIDEANSADIDPDVQDERVEALNATLDALNAKKILADQPIFMDIDASAVNEALRAPLEKLQEYQNTVNELAVLKLKGDVDTSEAEEKLNTLRQELSDELAGMDSDVKVQVGLAPEWSSDRIYSALGQGDNGSSFLKTITIPTTADISTAQAQIDQVQDKDITVKAKTVGLPKVTALAGAINKISSKAITVTANVSGLEKIQALQSKISAAGSKISGKSSAEGTAFASGKSNVKASTESLVGELGPEIVVRDGRWFTVGDNGAELIPIRKDDIIFNAAQTEEILKKGRLRGYNTRAHAAYAQGSAFAAGKTLSSLIASKVSSKKNLSSWNSGSKGTRTTNSGGAKSAANKSKSTSKSSTKKGTGNSPSTPSGKDGETALEKFQDWLSSLFDWIEVRLERQTDRISDYISRAEAQLDGAEYNRAVGSYRNAISDSAIQSGTEAQAYDKYVQQADTVLKQAVSRGLISSNISQSIAKQVANGSINISEYSEEVREVIDSYKEWYDKAEDAKYAITELHANIQEYVKDLKDVRDAQRDARLESIETYTKTGTSGYAYASGFSNSQLNFSNYQLKKQNAAYDAEASAVAGDTNALRKQANSSLGSQLKSSDGKSNEAYRKALTNAQRSIKAQEAVADSDLNVIAKYSRPTYENLFAYNLALGNLETARLEQAANYAATSSDLYANIAEVYKNNDTVSNSKIDLYLKKAQNRTSAKDKNALLDKVAAQYDTILSNDKAEISRYANNTKVAGNTIAKNSGRGSQFNAVDKASRERIQKQINAAKESVKKGTSIDAVVIANLAEYYSKGYISQAFYRACIDYNNALQHKLEADAALEIDKATVAAEKAALGTERLSNVSTEYTNQQKANQSKTDMITAKQATKTTRGLSLNQSDYTDLIKQNATDMSIYQKQAAALNQVMAENLSKGYWTKSSQEYKDAAEDVAALDVKIQECKTSQEEYNNAIAQLPFDKIEAVLDLQDAISSNLKSRASIKSALGNDLSKDDYTKQMNVINDEIVQKQKGQQQAYQNYLKAMANSSKVYAGKTAEQWRQMYLDFDTDINNLRADNEALKDALRDDVYWRTFERAHDAAQRFQDTLSGLADLIQESQYYDEDGGFTALGAAQVANYISSLETARKEVKNYSNDISNLNKLYKDGWYTTDEYKEKLSELQTGLLDSASSIQTYINNIMGMYKNQAQAELDAVYKLIDARNDALQKKKEYYDYDKTIKGKSKDIQSLQAQIAALEGVEGAEAKAQKARLQAELAAQQEDLNDTVNEHLLELSQSALDDLKTALQDSFDKYWDNLWTNLNDVKEVVDRATKASEASAATISKSMNALLKFYGINASSTGIDAAYASGAKKVPRKMTALTQEDGDEIIVTKDGLLTPLSKGDGVVPAELTQRLYDLASNYDVLRGVQLPKMNAPDIKVSASRETVVEQHYDSLINVEGSVDTTTMHELEKMSDKLLKASYEYSQKQMSKNMLLAGYKKKF